MPRCSASGCCPFRGSPPHCRTAGFRMALRVVNRRHGRCCCGRDSSRTANASFVSRLRETCDFARSSPVLRRSRRPSATTRQKSSSPVYRRIAGTFIASSHRTARSAVPAALERYRKVRSTNSVSRCFHAPICRSDTSTLTPTRRRGKIWISPYTSATTFTNISAVFIQTPSP